MTELQYTQLTSDKQINYEGGPRQYVGFKSFLHVLEDCLRITLFSLQQEFLATNVDLAFKNDETSPDALDSSFSPRVYHPNRLSILLM